VTLIEPDVAKQAAEAAPSIPRDHDGGPVFREPWEAQAFAMAHYCFISTASSLLANGPQRSQRRLSGHRGRAIPIPARRTITITADLDDGGLCIVHGALAHHLAKLVDGAGVFSRRNVEASIHPHF